MILSKVFICQYEILYGSNLAFASHISLTHPTMPISPARSRSPRRGNCSTLAALNAVYKHEAVASLQEQRVIIEEQRLTIEEQKADYSDATDVIIAFQDVLARCREIIIEQRRHIASQEEQMTNLLRESSRMGRALTAHGIEWP
jgi:hypothetical protein